MGVSGGRASQAEGTARERLCGGGCVMCWNRSRGLCGWRKAGWCGAE